jgi:DNA primase
LDPDAAGDKATLRGLQLARQTLDRESDPVFDARGLLGYEARLQADIRVSTLPGDLDPDEVVNRDPQEWQRIIDAARPIVVHVMETLAAGHDLDDPKIKNEIAAQVLPLIEDVPSSIERDTYLQQLARLLRVDERALLDARTGIVRTRTHRRRPGRQAPADGTAWVFSCAARLCSTRWTGGCRKTASAAFFRKISSTLITRQSFASCMNRLIRIWLSRLIMCSPACLYR